MNFSQSLLVIGVALVLGGIAHSNDEAMEQELNQLYSKQLATEKMIQDQRTAKSENTPVVAPESAPAATAAAVPTVTVNTQVNSLSAPMAESSAAPTAISTVPAQPTVHNSPASTIEAAPLSPSRADHLRKARQDVEMQTEQAIVEQLEATRLENEKKRSQLLLKKISGEDEEAPQSVQVVPANQVVAPAPAPAANPEVNQLKQDVAALKEAQNKPKDENYFSFGVGMPNYQNVYNMKSDASIGFGWGFKSPNNVVFQADLYYSLLRIERPTTAPIGFFPEIDNVDQYNGSAAVKYSFFSGKIRPLIGAIASYTYREYSCGQFYVCNGRSRSHALDAGGLVGGEVQVSDTFSVGVEYQWFRNLSYRTEAAIQPSMFYAMYPTGRIEDKDYSIFTVRGRVTF